MHERRIASPRIILAFRRYNPSKKYRSISLDCLFCLSHFVIYKRCNITRLQWELIFQLIEWAITLIKIKKAIFTYYRKRANLVLSKLQLFLRTNYMCMYAKSNQPQVSLTCSWIVFPAVRCSRSSPSHLLRSVISFDKLLCYPALQM